MATAWRNVNLADFWEHTRPRESGKSRVKAVGRENQPAIRDTQLTAYRPTLVLFPIRSHAPLHGFASLELRRAEEGPVIEPVEPSDETHVSSVAGTVWSWGAVLEH